MRNNLDSAKATLGVDVTDSVLIAASPGKTIRIREVLCRSDGNGTSILVQIKSNAVVIWSGYITPSNPVIGDTDLRGVKSALGTSVTLTTVRSGASTGFLHVGYEVP